LLKLRSLRLKVPSFLALFQLNGSTGDTDSQLSVSIQEDEMGELNATSIVFWFPEVEALEATAPSEGVLGGGS
jgi:hypothetical protein